MNVGHVQNGTHAGWKIQKPAPKPWSCLCFIGTGTRYDETDTLPAHVTLYQRQPAYMARCTDCGTRRP